MPTRVVVLGAGFGGLELTTRLADEFGDKVHVTLIDKSEAFEMIDTSAVVRRRSASEPTTGGGVERAGIGALP